MNAAEKFNNAVSDSAEDATALYLHHAVGTPLPDHLVGIKVNLMMLKSFIGKVASKAEDLIDIPFDIDEIRTLKDMMHLSGRVMKAYASGQMGAKAADQMFNFIRGHRKMIESVEVMKMIEALQTDHTKLLGMKEVGAGASKHYVPELVDNPNGPIETIVVDTEEVQVHHSRQPMGVEVVFTNHN